MSAVPKPAIWAAVTLVTLLTGCSAAPRVAAVAEPEAPASGGDVDVAVSVLGPGDVAKPKLHSAGQGFREAGKITGLMAAVGGVATLATGPVGASAGATGVGIALLLSPVLIVEGAMNGAQRDSILRAMEAADFPARLKRALQRRLAADVGLRLEVAVQRYGFVNDGRGGSRLCFDASVMVNAAEGQRVVLQEDVVMGEGVRTADVPPPECGMLADIGRADGRVASRVVMDSAEILAAVIVKHVRAAR